jgi:hypothetical protein
LYIRDCGMSFATAVTWGFNFIVALSELSSLLSSLLNSKLTSSRSLPSSARCLQAPRSVWMVRRLERHWRRPRPLLCPRGTSPSRASTPAPDKADPVSSSRPRPSPSKSSTRSSPSQPASTPRTKLVKSRTLSRSTSSVKRCASPYFSGLGAMLTEFCPQVGPQEQLYHWENGSEVNIQSEYVGKGEAHA